MKRIHTFLVGAVLAFPFFTACEKDLPVYNNPDCGLKFDYYYERDSLVGYSFAFAPSELNLQEDTVWFEVQLVGIPVDYDRPIALRQITTGRNDAVPGKHYVPFDEPALASKMVLPANAIETKIPIVVKRDASLKTSDYTLKVTFQPNEAFVYAAKERAIRSVLIADQLIKPNNWNTYCDHFFGDYSKAKHQLMIDATGFRWDNEFVDGDGYYYYLNDQNVLTGWQKKVQFALDEYEATHGEPMRDENGNIISLGF